MLCTAQFCLQEPENGAIMALARALGRAWCAGAAGVASRASATSADTDPSDLQVVPRLRPRDVQAVSQACRALRACVQTGIPAASWAATTSSSLAALLTGSSMDCYARLQRQAASHAALLAGSQPAMAASLGLLWPPPAGPGPACDVGPTPDSSGLLWASLHRDRLQVHMLEPGPRWELLLDQPSPEVSPSAEMRTAKMCWAPDSSQLALHIETLDPTVHPAAGFDGSQERVYLVRARCSCCEATLTLAEWAAFAGAPEAADGAAGSNG